MSPPKKIGHKRIRRKKKNPSKGLSSAKRLSKAFHGNVDVVELSAKERKPLGRFATVIGEVVSIIYAPNAKSRRGKNLWEHRSGERGMFKPKSKNRPLLVADPKSKRPAIVLNKSPMRLNSRKGLIG